MRTSKETSDRYNRSRWGEYVPLRLKLTLRRHGIRQTEWAGAVQLTDTGRGMSAASMKLLINHGQWPRKTPRESIERQTEAFLRSRDVPEAEIGTVWEEDTEDRAFHEARKAGPYCNAAPTSNDRGCEFDKSIPENEMLSQSARQHFKLFRDPFQDDVQSPDDVYLSKDQRYIREAMFMTAKHGGFLAVVGESGAGKSVLRRDLIDRIRREGHPVTVIQPRIIDKGRLTAGAICDAITGDLSQDRPPKSLEARARQIERLLTGSSRAGNSHVLIIEEAHDLTVQTLKYLKRFWELEDGFRKLLAIILIGQPELKGKLDERQNWEAREVIRRCEIAELLPLNGDLEEYLSLKFKRLNKPLAEVFAPDAFDGIRTRLTGRRRGTDEAVSMHYPLVVNRLVVKAMNLAASTGESKVTAEVVMAV